MPTNGLPVLELIRVQQYRNRYFDLKALNSDGYASRTDLPSAATTKSNVYVDIGFFKTAMCVFKLPE